MDIGDDHYCDLVLINHSYTNHFSRCIISESLSEVTDWEIFGTGKHSWGKLGGERVDRGKIYWEVKSGREHPTNGLWKESRWLLWSLWARLELKWFRTMATQTSLAMAGARVAGIPPVNVPGLLVNPPVRKKGFIGAISSTGQWVHFSSSHKVLLQENPMFKSSTKCSI